MAKSADDRSRSAEGAGTGRVSDVFPTDRCSLSPQEAPDEASFEAASAFMARGFGHLDLRGIHNGRDLGGMPGADGRTIRPGRLIRTDALADATHADLRRLQSVPVKWVVDLRTDTEASHAPDPMKWLPDARHEHLSVLSASAMGITDDENIDGLVEHFSDYHDDAAGQSIEFYPSMLLSEAAVAGWRRFFDLLLATEEGAVLWHCSAGKDRTGLAGFLVETALGVPQDLVVEDYLASNIYTDPLVDVMLREAGMEHLAPKTVEMIHVLFTVSASYLEVAVAAVLQRYDTLDAYYERALGLDAAKIDRLRDLYLEEPRS